MKKHMALLLCALMILASCATLPAMAAEQHYPVSVEEYTYGPLDELRMGSPSCPPCPRRAININSLLRAVRTPGGAEQLDTPTGTGCFCRC